MIETVAEKITVNAAEHASIAEAINGLKELMAVRFDALQSMDSWLMTLVIGAFVFTAGAYVFTWLVQDKVNTLQSNHLAHIEERLDKLEKTDA